MALAATKNVSALVDQDFLSLVGGKYAQRDTEFARTAIRLRYQNDTGGNIAIADYVELIFRMPQDFAFIIGAQLLTASGGANIGNAYLFHKELYGRDMYVGHPTVPPGWNIFTETLPSGLNYVFYDTSAAGASKTFNSVNTSLHNCVLLPGYEYTMRIYVATAVLPSTDELTWQIDGLAVKCEGIEGLIMATSLIRLLRQGN